MITCYSNSAFYKWKYRILLSRKKTWINIEIYSLMFTIVAWMNACFTMTWLIHFLIAKFSYWLYDKGKEWWSFPIMFYEKPLHCHLFWGVKIKVETGPLNLKIMYIEWLVIADVNGGWNIELIRQSFIRMHQCIYFTSWI